MIVYSHEYSRDYNPAAPIVEIVVRKTTPGGREVRLTALIDSGADATILPIDTLKAVGARHIETRQMRGVTGYPVAVETFLVTLQLGGYTLRGIEAVAMSEDAEAVIGRDVLNHLIVTLNGLAHIVEITN